MLRDLNDKPVMTVAMLLLMVAFVGSALADALPAEHAATLTAIVYAVGAVGKALYTIGSGAMPLPGDEYDDVPLDEGE